jgi:hypothetical protein
MATKPVNIALEGCERLSINYSGLKVGEIIHELSWIVEATQITNFGHDDDGRDQANAA